LFRYLRERIITLLTGPPPAAALSIADLPAVATAASVSAALLGPVLASPIAASAARSPDPAAAAVQSVLVGCFAPADTFATAAAAPTADGNEDDDDVDNAEEGKEDNDTDRILYALWLQPDGPTFPGCSRPREAGKEKILRAAKRYPKSD
jgi:hypothetical protein